MSKISESIFKSKQHLIPMADVLFIEYNSDGKTGTVIMKNTQWSNYLIHGYDYWLNPLHMGEEELKAFERAYCYFRYELDIKESSDNNE